MFNAQTLHQYVKNQWQESIVPSLIDYIKIPNKSPHFDANWEKNGFMAHAVNHIATWCTEHAPSGMSIEVVKLEGRTPLIFMEIPGTTDKTVLLYGHLDKQPEMSGWQEGLGPWKPVLKDGKLYGRGGADDGYSAYASLTAIRALEAQGLPYPRCVLIIEACEESGSYDLPHYINHLKERIGTPSLVVCLDSGAGNYDQLWLTTSLRGNIVGTLCVELIQEGVHSGAASGVVPDSFRVAKSLISRIEDEATGEVKIPQLHCDIPKARISQASDCAAFLKEKIYSEFMWHDGVQPVTHDLTQLLLNKTWRPALTVTGADGFPDIANAGNVMRPKTALKLSMRLPPLVNPKEAGLAMQEALLSNPPYASKVSFDVADGSKGWNAPKLSDWFAKTLEESSTLFYGQSVGFIGEGGTIPFMAMLGEQFPHAEFMITGVLGPQSNAHGPNEFLHLDMAEKLTSCVAYVLYQFANA